MESFIVVISGFSGAGKGTLVKNLLSKFPSDYALSISATTRGPREGEQHGREYFFVDKDNFEEMIDNDQLLEYASYVGNYYGTPRKYVEEQLANQKCVLLEIEIQGAEKVYHKLPETKRIFVSTKDATTLYNRLKGRGTEAEDVIRKRMERAIEESDGCEVYDYLIINDDLEETTNFLHSIITNCRNHQEELNSAYKVDSQIDFINNMRKELISFSKGEKL